MSTASGEPRALPSAADERAITAAYHELRAPLSLIATAAHAAAAEADSESLRKRCDTIARVAERALRVARQVVEAARVTERPPVAGATHRPLQALECAVSDYRRLGLRIDLARHAGTDATLAQGDPADLEALLHVLLGEAIEHGAPDAPVQVAIRSRGAHVEISIANRIAGGNRAGAALGSFLRDRLVERLSAQLEVEQAGAEHRTRVLLRAARNSHLDETVTSTDTHREQRPRRVG